MVVIGPDVVERLFPNLDPIGREVRIGGLPYTVIGVTESQGSAFGMSFDNFVVRAAAGTRAPLVQHVTDHDRRGDGAVANRRRAHGDDGARAARSCACSTSCAPGRRTTSRCRPPTVALEFWNKMQGYLVLAGVALPAIGLVVGAIVIMNIMLVAVAERTA